MLLQTFSKYCFPQKATDFDFCVSRKLFKALESDFFEVTKTRIDVIVKVKKEFLNLNRSPTN